MTFEGKTALVTGASVGIGRAVAMKLAQNGANLVLLDIDYEKLEVLKGELADYNREVLIFKCDVSDENAVNEAIGAAEEKFGKIDIAVNNAALWKNVSPFLDVPIDLWKKYIDINVMGTVYVCRAVLPKMLENNYGKIINVASVAGVYGNATMTHYSATKGAVISFTKALAKEVADKGIYVNSVSPGTVSPSQNPDVNYYQEAERAYMGRSGTDMENANLICFLASDESGYILGQNIQIDGCRKIV